MAPAVLVALVDPASPSAPAQIPRMDNLPIMKQQEAIMIFFLCACVLMVGFVVALHTSRPTSPPSPPQSGPELSDSAKGKQREPTETTPLLLSSESSLFDSGSESSLTGQSDSSDSSNSSDSWLSVASAGR